MKVLFTFLHLSSPNLIENDHNFVFFDYKVSTQQHFKSRFFWEFTHEWRCLALAPSLLSYITKVFTNITIEPAYFLISFAAELDDVSLSQMTIYKSCRADFHYNDTVCENLVTDFKEENDIVQNEV